MKTELLGKSEILAGYDSVSPLYPHIPSMNLWRSWEVAAYRRYDMRGDVLDIGCGDGRFFNLLWPGCRTVTGIDLDANIVAAAKAGNIYTDVIESPASNMPTRDAAYDAAFANCSLEHMDDLPDVLSEIRRSLKPGGFLLGSVVTEKFVTLAALPALVQRLGLEEMAEELRKQHIKYHHLVNPLTVDEWRLAFSGAGFDEIVHTPIVPPMSTWLFLFIDALWHVPHERGELGEPISDFLSKLRDFQGNFRTIFEGLLEMDLDMTACSGAVFWARAV